MQPLRFPVRVQMEQVPLANRWVDAIWRPVAVDPVNAGAPVSAEVVALDAAERHQRYSFGGHEIELHPSEGEGYYLNLTSPAPCVFVMWRLVEDADPPARPVVVTVSYNEAARLLDGGEKVDNVPMPDVIREWMRPFVAEHYKPQARKKVKRNDPFESSDMRDPSRGNRR